MRAVLCVRVLLPTKVVIGSGVANLHEDIPVQFYVKEREDSRGH